MQKNKGKKIKSDVNTYVHVKKLFLDSKDVWNNKFKNGLNVIYHLW